MVIGPLIALAGFVVWWFRGWLFQAEKAGLKEQIGAIEQRLKLAADASGASERAKDELEKQFLAYKSEVAAKGKEASQRRCMLRLSKSPVAILTLGPAYQQRSRTLSLHNMGALRKLDAATLLQLKDLGKPSIGIDPTKKR